MATTDPTACICPVSHDVRTGHTAACEAAWDAAYRATLAEQDEEDDQRTADYRAERDAEDAWLRAAEMGDPETWAEEDAARMVAIYGYGPAPLP